MPDLIIPAATREKSTRSVLRQLREQGRVPGVLYGNEQSNLLISVDQRQLQELLQQASSSAVFTLSLDGAATGNVMIKALQLNPLSRRPVHIDLQLINMDEEVQVAIPLQLEGDAPGVREGGVLQIGLREVVVRALPRDLPSVITVDISNLELGQNITVGDLQLPGGLGLVSEPGQMVVGVVAARTAAEEVPETEVVSDGPSAATGNDNEKEQPPEH